MHYLFDKDYEESIVSRFGSLAATTYEYARSDISSIMETGGERPRQRPAATGADPFAEDRNQGTAGESLWSTAQSRTTDSQRTAGYLTRLAGTSR